MKKSLVSAALAASLVIPAAVPAFAATTPSDVIGTDVQSAVEVLNALGIIEGYEDGTFKPENSITRAELAKIIVIATGYESSAAAMQNTAPTFKDVKVSEWYTGYINVASAKGFIQGYNGNYRPNDTVKFEEVAAILVRALGYQESKLSGSWPYNYIIAGQDADLFDDLTISTGTAANRGTVAQMTANALDSYLVEYDSDGLKKVTDNKLITKLGNSEDYVLTGVAVDGDEISLGGKDFDVTENFVVTSGDDLVDLLGHTVTVLTNEDGDVVALADNQDEGLVLTSEFDWNQLLEDIIDDNGAYYVDGEVAYEDDDDVDHKNEAYRTVFVEDGDKKYETTKDTFFFLNGEEVKVDDEVEFVDGHDVTLYLNEDDEVVALVATDWEENQVVDDVEEDDDEAYINTKNGQTYELTDATVVTINGAVASVADLKEFDVIEVLVNSDDEAVKVAATRQSVSGELEAVSVDSDDDIEYTVNGKDYEVVEDSPAYESALTSDDIGEEFTFYLNADGDVVIYDGEAAVSGDFGVVLSVTGGTYVVDGAVPTADPDGDGWESYKVKYYSLADDAEYTTYTTDHLFAGYENYLLELAFDDDDILDFDFDGRPDRLDILGEADEVDSVSSTQVKIGSARYTLNSNTLYFAYDQEDGEVTKVDADELTVNDEAAVFVADNSTTAKYVFITNNRGDADLDQVQGLFVGVSEKSTSGKDYYYVTLAVGGKEVKYEVSKKFYELLEKANENDIITLPEGSGEYNGNSDDIVDFDEETTKVVSESGNILTVGSDKEEFRLTSNTLYYIIEADGDYKKSTKSAVLGKIEKGALVDGYQGIKVVGSDAFYNSVEEAGVVVLIENQD